ncbi:HesA/MoeB/ThiF family protein [Advenella sp. RU8]|uniref:HesA/MoeB/ThiF family protein n=1 Tax=Advenella sp. RU8 TaxID=3399575 RepID=UPI003AAEB0D9
MDDSQLLRYARHLMLDEIGFEGQQKIMSSRVLVVGVGGLGSPAAAYLAAAGVGQLVLVDDDQVDLSNLQRQILHTTERIGQPKVESARQALQALNPDTVIECHARRLDGPGLMALVNDADVVLDCTDNFLTRHHINRACVVHKKPLVSGAAIRFDGQIAVYDLRHENATCYACLFEPSDNLGPDNCATLGVFAPLVGIIGSMQAAEALKLLVGMPAGLDGRLLQLDARTMQWHAMQVQKNPQCPVCGSAHP